MFTFGLYLENFIRPCRRQSSELRIETMSLNVMLTETFPFLLRSN